MARPDFVLDADVHLDGVGNLEPAPSHQVPESDATGSDEQRVSLGRAEFIVGVGGLHSIVQASDYSENVARRQRWIGEAAPVASGQSRGRGRGLARSGQACNSRHLGCDWVAVWLKHRGAGVEIRSDAGRNQRELVEEQVVVDIHLVSDIRAGANRSLSVTFGVPGKTKLRPETILGILGMVGDTLPPKIEEGRPIDAGFIVEVARVILPAGAEQEREVGPRVPVVAEIPGDAIVCMAAVGVAEAWSHREEAIRGPHTEV